MVYRFGVYEFDDDTKELRKNGRAVALEPQPAKALAFLLSRAGDRGLARAEAIVKREELCDVLWGKETHVDFDRGLAYCVSQIRTALGDSGDNPRFVQTIPKRGFKFIAPLISATPPSGPLSAPVSHVLQAPPPFPPTPKPSTLTLAVAVLFFAATGALAFFVGLPRQRAASLPTIIGVSIFDNETGNPEYDRLVAGMSDLVVERLTKLDSNRLAVVGNATILRQPRNIRDLKAVARSLRADYVLLGQLQTGENGLRFITHFIRLSDEAHLKANRLTMPDGGITGLEAAVVEEFERATREYVLNQRAN